METAKPKRLTGNSFWKLRSTHGRAKIFGDARVLLEEAFLYFDWCDRHPWLKAELVKYQGDATLEDVPIGRPYTMDGLTLYLGVSGGYFRAAKGDLKEKKEKGRATEVDIDLLEAIELIEQTVRTQQIEGAAVGAFNTNLVARINGLADNVNNNQTGDAVIRVTVRDAQTAKDLDALDDLL